ncbi:MAG TPA: ABC transporter ATP-binding protein [Hyphomicrobiales bacterium]|nr:ABC transporter ATP-binding protein [Hyphomicrobiales bacterium]
MDTPLLRVNGIETWYGPVNAIKGVSLDVGVGAMVAVLGANGAGKTTLLNTIAGVIDPSKGSILFEDRAIHGLDPDAVARGGIALVPEGRQVFPFLTVRENLLMGSFARRERRGTGDDLDRVFGWFPRLRERLGQAAGLLSGGEQQMLAIGRALMARPRLLLLDEPSLGLSPLLTKEIFQNLRQINRETGTAILVVEQNAAISLATADDGYIMELGRVVMTGRCRDLAERDDVREFYLGRPPEHGDNGRGPRRMRRQAWR